MACFDGRIPPATLTPTRRPVSCEEVARRLHHAQRVRQGRVHADLARRGLDEVRAGGHREDARLPDRGRTSRARQPRGSPSGARSPAASRAATSSSNAARSGRPRNSDRFRTMSTSSAPARRRRGSPSAGASSGPRPAGNAPATLATFTPVPWSCLERDRDELRVEAHGRAPTGSTVERVRADGLRAHRRRPCRGCRRPRAS